MGTNMRGEDCERQVTGKEDALKVDFLRAAAIAIQHWWAEVNNVWRARFGFVPKGRTEDNGNCIFRAIQILLGEKIPSCFLLHLYIIQKILYEERFKKGFDWRRFGYVDTKKSEFGEWFVKTFLGGL